MTDAASLEPVPPVVRTVSAHSHALLSVVDVLNHLPPYNDPAKRWRPVDGGWEQHRELMGHVYTERMVIEQLGPRCSRLTITATPAPPRPEQRGVIGGGMLILARALKTVAEAIPADRVPPPAPGLSLG